MAQPPNNRVAHVCRCYPPILSKFTRLIFSRCCNFASPGQRTEEEGEKIVKTRQNASRQLFYRSVYRVSVAHHSGPTLPHPKMMDNEIDLSEEVSVEENYVPPPQRTTTTGAGAAAMGGQQADVDQISNRSRESMGGSPVLLPALPPPCWMHKPATIDEKDTGLWKRLSQGVKFWKQKWVSVTPVDLSYAPQRGANVPPERVVRFAEVCVCMSVNEDVMRKEGAEKKYRSAGWTLRTTSGVRMIFGCESEEVRDRWVDYVIAASRLQQVNPANQQMLADMADAENLRRSVARFGTGDGDDEDFVDVPDLPDVSSARRFGPDGVRASTYQQDLGDDDAAAASAGAANHSPRARPFAGSHGAPGTESSSNPSMGELPAEHIAANLAVEWAIAMSRKGRDGAAAADSGAPPVGLRTSQGGGPRYWEPIEAPTLPPPDAAASTRLNGGPPRREVTFSDDIAKKDAAASGAKRKTVGIPASLEPLLASWGDDGPPRPPLMHWSREHLLIATPASALGGSRSSMSRRGAGRAELSRKGQSPITSIAHQQRLSSVLDAAARVPCGAIPMCAGDAGGFVFTNDASFRQAVPKQRPPGFHTLGALADVDGLAIHRDDDMDETLVASSAGVIRAAVGLAARSCRIGAVPNLAQYAAPAAVGVASGGAHIGVGAAMSHHSSSQGHNDGSFTRVLTINGDATGAFVAPANGDPTITSGEPQQHQASAATSDPEPYGRPRRRLSAVMRSTNEDEDDDDGGDEGEEEERALTALYRSFAEMEPNDGELPQDHAADGDDAGRHDLTTKRPEVAARDAPFVERVSIETSHKTVVICQLRLLHSFATDPTQLDDSFARGSRSAGARPAADHVGTATADGGAVLETSSQVDLAEGPGRLSQRLTPDGQPPAAHRLLSITESRLAVAGHGGR